MDFKAEKNTLISMIKEFLNPLMMEKGFTRCLKEGNSYFWLKSNDWATLQCSLGIRRLSLGR